MYLPRSKITIGSKYFGGVHDIKIKRSIHTIGATASVKVPVTAVLRQTGTPPAYVETAQVIKAGDPVEIQLGYDGRLYTEFRGYVKLLNLQTPLEIVCEDEFYTTRRRNSGKDHARCCFESLRPAGGICRDADPRGVPCGQ